MTTLSVTSPVRADAAQQFRRLLVSVQETESRAYRPLGFLSREASGFRFRYLRSMAAREGFGPLPALPDRPEGVRSQTLFPVFAERVMSPRRPEYGMTLDAMDLDADAVPFEVLARSGGRRVGDLLEVTEAPEAAPGDAVSVTFLVHGIRHVAGASEAVDLLHAGDELTLLRDDDNCSDPQAVAVHGGSQLGWVPRPLCELVRDVMLNDHSLTVVRANPPDVGFHLRLLVRLAGTVTRAPFTGAEWD